MTEYITKNQAIHAMEQVTQPECFIEDTRKDFAKIIEKLPAADVAPVVHTTTSGEYWDEAYCKWKVCGNCHGDNVSAAKYCNWCGARLDGEHHG